MATDLYGLAVVKLNRWAIRKGRKVAVLVADMDTPVPTSITEAASASAAPTLKAQDGFRALGLLSKEDGVVLGREREVSGTMAIGFDDPVITEKTSDRFRVQCIGLETNRATMERYLEVDLSEVKRDATTGELNFPQSTDGEVPQNRILTLAQDRTRSGPIWWGRCLLAGELAETDDQTLGAMEGVAGWPMTFQSGADVEAGYSVHHYIGGPGFKAIAPQLGFAA